MYTSSGHTWCRWVFFFMGTDFEKFSMTSLAHQWIIIHMQVHNPDPVKYPSSVVFSHHNPPTYLFRIIWDWFYLWKVLDLCIFLSWFRKDDLFTVESNVMEDLYFSWKQQFEVKSALMDLFLINTVYIFPKHELRDYLWIIMMFLSAIWTLILTAPIHCRGSIGEQVIQC